MGILYARQNQLSIFLDLGVILISINSINLVEGKMTFTIYKQVLAHFVHNGSIQTMV